MKSSLTSTRLELNELSPDDAPFILELLNTEGWKRFIGDRNISSVEDAAVYIQKILDNPNVTYWVVRLKVEKEAVGVITFIKRDYLEHNDIGFAFLPAYAKQGYAYEAAQLVLNEAINSNLYDNVLATTIPENESSISLLKKLGLSFKEQIEVGEVSLSVYSLK
jgi:RimJ/RimL family protein N-acetyltransferase